jgi:hypothetical protein
LSVVAEEDSLRRAVVVVAVVVVFHSALFILRLERTQSLLVLVVPRLLRKQGALHTSAQRATQSSPLVVAV